MALKFGYDMMTPTELMPEGSYEISEAIFDLWIC